MRPGDALRVKILQRVPLLAGADQLDRLARHGAHGKRRAAAAVAVHAGQHDAGDADALVEAGGELDGVLAGQAVGDQQRLVRLGDVAHLRRLLHQRFVDVDAPRSVEQHHVVGGELGRLDGAPGDLLRRLAGNDRQGVDLGLLAEHAQLLLRRRPSRVERGHQHFLLVARGEPVPDLGRGGGLAGALQAHHHDGDGRLGGKVDGIGVGAQHRHQLVVHDLDDHLARRDRFDHVLADSLGLHLLGEVAHDLERHVGFQQGAAHLAHGFADVAVGERAAAGELVEDAREAVRQTLKHRASLILRPQRHAQ